MNQIIILVGLVLFTVFGVIFSVITTKNKPKIEKIKKESISAREKKGNGQTKPLRKRIKIAAINGIISAILLSLVNTINAIMGIILVSLAYWLLGLLVGLLIFAVNVVFAMTWEKNENVKTKSKLKIFLSPVIKGVIIGPIIYIMGTVVIGIGTVNGVVDGAVNGAVNGAVFCAAYGVVIGLLQLLVLNMKKSNRF